MMPDKSKNKENILKATRGKKITSQGGTGTSAVDFLADPVEASRQWHYTLEMWKENNST